MRKISFAVKMIILGTNEVILRLEDAAMMELLYWPGVATEDLEDAEERLIVYKAFWHGHQLKNSETVAQVYEVSRPDDPGNETLGTEPTDTIDPSHVKVLNMDIGRSLGDNDKWPDEFNVILVTDCQFLVAASLAPNGGIFQIPITDILETL